MISSEIKYNFIFTIRLMNHIEQRFWRVITRFGELPGIIMPLSMIALSSWRAIYQWFLHDVSWSQSLQSWSLPYIIESAFRPIWIGFWWVFLSYSIGTVIKYFYYKPRPIPRDTSTLWRRINAWSMPSIHASNGLITAISLVMTVFALPINLDLYPWAILAGYWCIILWFFYYLSIALSRIALQKHYPIDVLIGSLFGICIICIMWYIGYNIISSNIINHIIALFL